MSKTPLDEIWSQTGFRVDEPELGDVERDLPYHLAELHSQGWEVVSVSHIAHSAYYLIVSRRKP